METNDSDTPNLVGRGGLNANLVGELVKLEYKPDDQDDTEVVYAEVSKMIPSATEYGPRYRGVILDRGETQPPLNVLPSTGTVSQPRDNHPGYKRIGGVVTFQKESEDTLK